MIRNGMPTRLLSLLVSGALIGALGGCLIPETVTSDPSNEVKMSHAKRDLGVDYLSSRRTGMAIRELRASMELDPMDPQTHLWLGEAYRRKGRAEEAEAYLKSAIEIAVDIKDTRSEQEARLNLSGLFSQMGRYEEALPHCDLIAKDPTFSSPWRPLTNCGWSLMQLGRYNEARAHFVEALDFYPRFGPALLNLGILEAKEGHKMAAITTLGKAISSNRLGGLGIAEAHYRLGEVYMELGRRDKAIVEFTAAADKAPNADWGSQSQAYLDLLR
jgi:tetratricopeptide (TPR) repeat protein